MRESNDHRLIFGVGIQPVVVIWAVVVVVIGIVLRRTAAGCRLYATGANPIAAELALVNTLRVWIATFAVSAAWAAYSVS